MRLSRIRLAGLVPLLLLAAWPLAAADTLTPFDVARIRSVSAVSISPDGSRVAYTLSVPRRVLDEEDGAAWAELHVVGRDGASRAYVTGAVNVSDVAWTKDGREISFIAKRGKDEYRCLYSIPADGGEARRLLCHDGDITSYSFAPDGKRLAYLATDEPSKNRKDLEKKGFNQQVYEESARPVRIWLGSIEPGGAKPKALEVQGSASELRWSPVGTDLAVAIAPNSLVDESYMSRRIAIVDADSGKVVARVENPGKLGQIAWSPDGKNVAYVAGADKNDPSAGRLMAVSGGGAAQPAARLRGNVGQIARRDATRSYFRATKASTILGEVSAGHPGRPTNTRRVSRSRRSIPATESRRWPHRLRRTLPRSSCGPSPSARRGA
jgi:dipeptidyl aminopeptidase/acylaminoacyl peptidase